jgi:hypothetical protein
MMETMVESEWKVFRKVRAVALERFCERVLSGVDRLAHEPGQSAHERYRSIFQFLRQRDKELALAFDDSRRSRAVRQLTCMVFYEMLTEDELACFSQQTRDSVQFLLSISRD